MAKNYWDDSPHKERCDELYKKCIKEAKFICKKQGKEFDKKLVDVLVHNSICIFKFPRFK